MNAENDNLNGRPRLDSLQAVRALAFLGIFTSHCAVGQFGAWGVSVFIIMSGFLMFYSYRDRDIDRSVVGSLRFSIKKISRLYPLHVLTATATFVLVIPGIVRHFSFIGLAKQIFLYAINLLLLQDWFPNASVYFSLNGVAWYLSVCLFIYFAFPIILKYLKKLDSIKQAVLLSLSIYLVQCLAGVCLYFINIDVRFIDNFSKWIIYILPVFRLGDFIIGCCWGYIFVNRKATYNSIKCSVSELLVSVAVIAAVYVYDNRIGFFGAECFRYNMLFTVSSIALVYLFAVNQGVISRFLTRKPLIWLGNISAYTFLIHLTIIRYLDILFDRVLDKEINKYAEMIIAFVITIACAEVYRAIERRIIAAKK